MKVSQAMVVVMCVGCWCAAQASAEPEADPADTAGPHETGEVGPWIPSDRAPALQPVRPTKFVTRGPFTSVQVNIDAFGGNTPGDAANETTIAVDPTAPNRIVIGWRQFDAIESDFRQAGYAYSHDGGRTWAFPGVLAPGVARSDPVVGCNADGVFYYYSLSFVDDPFYYFLHSSTDAGVTWTDGVYAYGWDKGWMAIDRTDGIGRGNMYFYWTGVDQFTRSTDGGQSFIEPMEFPARVKWGTLDVGPDGELYIVGTFSGATVIERSDDAQDAEVMPTFDWVTEVGLGGRMVIGGDPNPGGLLGQVWVAADHSDGSMRGNVYVLCSVDPSGADDPLDVMFTRSTDRGETWSFPVRINDDPVDTNAWQWFGTMSVAPNGRIDAVWYDTRCSGETNISELYYSYSIDAGDTWAPNQVLSPPFDSWIGWPNQSKIGDYIGMTSDLLGANIAYSATFNSEQDVYFLRIGPYDCNQNGIDDAEDIAVGDSPDCNENGIPDECELAAGTAADGNGNGILDECEFDCPGDVDGDRDVDQNDLGVLLASYDLMPGDLHYNEGADIDADGDVDQSDLGILLANYGITCDE
ncbi:MAG: exo-alpha-sialidase [Phycisphaerales bacterium]|nr:exo-alpha-sialidase [Phycisphaerales bacterium]